MRRVASASGMGIGMRLRRSVTCPLAVHPSDDVEQPPAVHNDINPLGELNVRKKAPPPPPPPLASSVLMCSEIVVTCVCAVMAWLCRMEARVARKFMNDIA